MNLCFFTSDHISVTNKTADGNQAIRQLGNFQDGSSHVENDFEATGLLNQTWIKTVKILSTNDMSSDIPHCIQHDVTNLHLLNKQMQCSFPAGNESLRIRLFNTAVSKERPNISVLDSSKSQNVGQSELETELTDFSLQEAKFTNILDDLKQHDKPHKLKEKPVTSFGSCIGRQQRQQSTVQARSDDKQLTNEQFDEVNRNILQLAQQLKSVQLELKQQVS